MKKKITALFLCVALAAIAIVGASLAYFTDTDNETNTFTVGGVKIDLIEQQSNEDHTGFVPYTGDKVLMPIVGSVHWLHSFSRKNAAVRAGLCAICASRVFKSASAISCCCCAVTSSGKNRSV